VPRPRSLTRAAIATAALTVLDRDGLDALSMRAVAIRLGVGTMSLYRYVADRDELEVLLVDNVLDDVDLTVPTRAAWQRQVTVLLDRMRTAVRRHPAVVPLVVAHRHAAPASLRWVEAMLTVLAGAGFTGKPRVVAQRTLVGFLLGALQNEQYGPLTGPGTTVMAELPADAFPLLTATAVAARRMSADEEFRRGLDIVLRGLDGDGRTRVVPDVPSA
jgi:AcrR family transcriptional regulator